MSAILDFQALKMLTEKNRQIEEYDRKHKSCKNCLNAERRSTGCESYRFCLIKTLCSL